MASNESGGDECPPGWNIVHVMIEDDDYVRLWNAAAQVHESVEAFASKLVWKAVREISKTCPPAS
jgi:hypothetical protein